MLNPNEGCRLLSLPPEILLQALLSDDDDAPKAIARFSETCTVAHAFTQTPALWRSLFLSLWDAPPHTIDDQPFDYRAAVQQRVAARTELVVAVREKQFPSTLSVETLQALVDVARARPAAGDFGRFSLNQDWLTTCIPSDYLSNPHPSPTRSRRMTVAPRPTEAETLAVQLAAQLHVLQTPTVLTLSTHALRTSARESVYERSNCTRASLWGPFSNDGSGKVDWAKVEALQVVMGAGLLEAEAMGWGIGDDEEGNGGAGVVPRGWNSTRPGEVREGRDWAGVEDGVWRGTYQFLDYQGFAHYNFHRSATWTPTLEDESEAVGDCMSLNLKLLPPGQLPLPPDPTDGGFDFDFDSDPSEDDSDNGEDEDYDNGPFLVGARRVAPTPSLSSAVDEADPPDPSRPPLSFVGTSEPLHFQGSFSNATRGMASRSIRGTVRMSAEGAVIWRMVIRYGGSDQWLMSGVQVGGPRSKYGMVGNWSTADHDDAGPVGPFHYFPHQPASA